MLAWSAAAIVAIGVASWGVALVGRSVTGDRPAPLAEVEERLSEVAARSSTTASPPPTSAPSGTVRSTLPGPATTGVPPGPAPAPPTTAAGPGPSPTAVAPPAAAGETRTYTLVGGTASLRFSPSGVTVVFANPAQGFDVEIQPEHGNGVRVEFESESHESRLDAWWDGGPRDEVEEDAHG